MIMILLSSKDKIQLWIHFLNKCDMSMMWYFPRAFTKIVQYWGGTFNLVVSFCYGGSFLLRSFGLFGKKGMIESSEVLHLQSLRSFCMLALGQRFFIFSR